MIRARLAAAIAITDMILFAAAVIVGPNPDYGADALYLLGIGAYVGIGVLLVRRVPANPIGVVMVATGTLAVAAAVLGTYADLGVMHAPPWPAAERARLIADAMFVYPILVALVGIPLIFPDGHLPSRRFRIVVVLWIAGMAAWTLNSVFGTNLDLVVLVSIPIAFAGAVIAVSLRFRRGDPIQREQVKWLAAVVVVGTSAVLSGLFLNDVRPDLANALLVIGILALFTMPLAIGIAILRYRLYEIDRIISRTLGYVVITTVLIGCYAALVVGIGGPLARATGGDTVSVALSTLAVAALFQPLRRRVQSVVDRRFDRARIDSERTATAFAGRLRDQVDIDTVMADLDGTVRGALRPSLVSLLAARARLMRPASRTSRTPASRNDSRTHRRAA